MPFEVKRSALDSGVILLALSGTMTRGNQLQQLEWTVAELGRNEQNKIVMDMSQVTYVDSSAIGVLVACHGTVRESGGQLRVAGVANRVFTIFKMTGIDGVLNIDPTSADSLSAMAANS